MPIVGNIGSGGGSPYNMTIIELHFNGADPIPSNNTPKILYTVPAGKMARIIRMTFSYSGLTANSTMNAYITGDTINGGGNLINSVISNVVIGEVFSLNSPKLSKRYDPVTDTVQNNTNGFELLTRHMDEGEALNISHSAPEFGYAYVVIAEFDKA